MVDIKSLIQACLFATFTQIPGASMTHEVQEGYNAEQSDIYKALNNIERVAKSIAPAILATVAELTGGSNEKVNSTAPFDFFDIRIL